MIAVSKIIVTHSRSNRAAWKKFGGSDWPTKKSDSVSARPVQQKRIVIRDGGEGEGGRGAGYNDTCTFDASNLKHIIWKNNDRDQI